MGEVPHADSRVLAVRRRYASRWRHHGRERPARSAGDREVMTYDAIVIGAGPNGLVAGAILAKHGRKTLVVESSPEIGGHTRALEFAPGFRAPLNEDCGWLPPSVAMSLGLGDSLRTTTPPQSLIYMASDGRLRSLPSDAGSAANAIREYSPKDAAAWPGFVDRLH